MLWFLEYFSFTHSMMSTMETHRQAASYDTNRKYIKCLRVRRDHLMQHYHKLSRGFELPSFRWSLWDACLMLELICPERWRSLTFFWARFCRAQRIRPVGDVKHFRDYVTLSVASIHLISLIHRFPILNDEILLLCAIANAKEANLRILKMKIPSRTPQTGAKYFAGWLRLVDKIYFINIWWGGILT